MDRSVPFAAPPTTRPAIRDRRGFVYEAAVSPRLKILLNVVFAAFAILAATGAYLAVIRLAEWARDYVSKSVFPIWMLLVHTLVGVAITLPFLYFGLAHYATARLRKNKLAVKLGLLLFACGILVVVSGLALIQLPGFPQIPTRTVVRNVTYTVHLLLPVAAIVLYVLHRRAGPDIQWKWAGAWGGGVTLFIAGMTIMHFQTPANWGRTAPQEGDNYFNPSLSRTSDGKFLSAQALMMDQYCLKCHEDIYNDHYHSAHKFSSFNNPPYLFSVRETRQVSLKRDGNVKASRWCAGCHDVVPFMSGAFDDPNFDDVKHPTAHAGLTCTVCHAMIHINSTRGNGDYVLEEPQHYPFAYSDNAVLQWINNQLVKAKPDFHKKTFLKPFHRNKAEFCSTCHKVSLPMELNHYKEFLRGQNHYDPFLLSGVSGHGARAFYYPPVAKTSCAECHMPLKPSNDFGSKDFDDSGTRKVHNHMFPGANTGIPYILSLDPNRAADADGFRRAIQFQSDFLRGTDPEGKDKKLRIDLFGLREGDSIDGKFLGQLRPDLPTLTPGSTYLVEVVLRTLNVGHVFPQGTADSNEIWVDFEARS
ncbi:MAG TPA: multiheme c-type cytochrome, partial [Gemmataceae bacterium]|nr:multiheme c-type cytochrome [Gemmataceae bacterium]